MLRLEVSRLLFLAAASIIPATPSRAAADPPLPAQKPPLSKDQERTRFHPRTVGMDAKSRLAGYARREEMERASPLAGIRFRNVGPEIQGGRVVDLDSPRNRPDSLIVAFATGGLWRTDNRGGSWTPLFDHESTITIGDFALGDDEGNTIWLGTGESNSSRSSYAGTGVFLTRDGGKTWKNVGLSDCHHVARILVDRRAPGTVYVAAVGHLYTESSERGVFKTTDGGQTWSRILAVDDRTGAIDLVQDPSRPDVLYASTWERARTAANFLESGPGSGAWKSTDAGKTWKRLTTGLPGGATVGRIGLALAASHPDTVYAVLDNQARRPDTEPFDEETPPGEITARRLRRLERSAFARIDDAVVERFLKRYDFPKSLKASGLKKALAKGTITVADLVAFLQDSNRELFENQIVGPEVYRSDDGGASWRKTHEGRLDKLFYSYGYYFGRIEVDPENPDRVYVLGVPALASSDGGKTWKGLDARGLHGDYHSLFIDPKAPNRIVIGNDGGLNVSYDHGATWSKINNLPVGQFTTLALDNAEPYNILGGLQDNGVLRGPSTYQPGKSDPNSWKPIYGGDGSCVAADPKDPNTVYAALQFGYASRLNLKTGERIRIRPRPELSEKIKEKPLRYNWVSPFLLSSHSREILYFGTNRVYRSFDRGDTWTAISGDLTSNPEQGDVPFGTVTTLSESPKRFGVLYAGTDDGRVWGTRDGGAAWVDLSRGLARGRWVTRVVASAFDEGTVYASQNGYRNDDFRPYLYRSTDFGKTWSSLAGGLPAEPINSVREDPKARHLLYVATDSGVFVSLDRGSSWLAMSGGLPHVPVHDLLVHPREGDLVVATHGRSVLVAETAPLRRLRGETLKSPLTAFPVKTIRSRRDRGYGENPWSDWFRVEPLARISFWSHGGGESGSVRIKDENGSVWKELDTPVRPGLNVLEYDLSADPRLADAAEKTAREKALEKKRESEKKEKEAAETEKAEGKAKADTPETASGATPPADPEKAQPPPNGSLAEERSGKAKTPREKVAKVEDFPEEDETTDETEAKTDRGPAKPLDPDLYDALADPFREKRKRYLTPGKYTIEIRSGSTHDKTTLTIKPEGDETDDEDEP